MTKRLNNDLIRENFNVKKTGNTLYTNDSVVYHQPLAIPKEAIEPIKYMPTIASIMLTKDNYEILEQAISTLHEQDVAITLYVGDTGSNDYARVKKIVSKYNNKQLKIVPIQIKDGYDYSKNHNFIFNKYIKDNYDLMFFMNNDLKFIKENNTLKRMIWFYLANDINATDEIKQAYPNDNRVSIGTVGCQLLFPYTRRVQHAGMFLDYEPFEQKFTVGHDGHNSYIYNYDTKEVFGNTFALALTSTKLYDQIGGLNESYNSMFQDLEYNVECIVNGSKNYIIGSAIAYHYESETRIGSEKQDPYQKWLKQKADAEMMKLDYEILNPFIASNESYLRPYIAYYMKKHRLAFALNNVLQKFDLTPNKIQPFNFADLGNYVNYSRVIMVSQPDKMMDLVQPYFEQAV